MLSEIGAMFEAENGIIIRFGFINSNSYLKQKTLSLERADRKVPLAEELPKFVWDKMTGPILCLSHCFSVSIAKKDNQDRNRVSGVRKAMVQNIIDLLCKNWRQFHRHRSPLLPSTTQLIYYPLGNTFEHFELLLSSL